MRQKNQVKLNLGAGAAGEARNAATQESEIRAAKACLERPAAPQADQSAEPPCTDPYARWCGRGGAVTRPPIPIARRGVERR